MYVSTSDINVKLELITHFQRQGIHFSLNSCIISWENNQHLIY
jgi:hypothetical protein